MGKSSAGRWRWRVVALVGSAVLVAAFLLASRIPPVRRGYFLWQLERCYRSVPREQASSSVEFSRVMYYQEKLVAEGEPIVQPLLALRHKYDYLWYWTTTTAVGALGSPETEPALVRDTELADPAVVCQALTALASLPELHCQERVLTLLGNPVPEIRARAVYLVTKYRIRAASPILVTMLRSDPDPTVRALTMQGVVRLEGREAVPLLIQALDDAGVTEAPLSITVGAIAYSRLQDLTGERLATKADWERWWQEEQAGQSPPSLPAP